MNFPRGFALASASGQHHQRAAMKQPLNGLLDFQSPTFTRRKAVVARVVASVTTRYVGPFNLGDSARQPAANLNFGDNLAAGDELDHPEVEAFLSLIQRQIDVQ